jgi:hypothetical protein
VRELSEFDIPHSLISADDPITILIGVHLHLEAFLIELVTRSLAKPAALDLDRLNFPSKLGLAVALGVVPELAFPALKSINSLRNRLAHNLNAELTDSDARRLVAEMQFVRSASALASIDPLGPAQQIALCAIVLQAWMNGVVEAQKLSSVSEATVAAAKRYPLLEDALSKRDDG